MGLVLEMRKPTNFIPCRVRRRIALEKLEGVVEERQREALKRLPPPTLKPDYHFRPRRDGSRYTYRFYGKN